MRWWSQLHQVAPMATVSHLALKSQPSAGWLAQLALHIPQQGAMSTTHEGADRQSVGVSLPWASEAANDDPGDVRAWAQTQAQHVQQHPSYARWVAPELRRTRTHLETLPRERLRYVGRVSQDGLQQALLRWSETTSIATHAPIYRVAVGDYVGQDFGRVQSIAADQLTLRELVRNAQGVWQPRDVTLLLEDGAK
jgi:Tfp pilus assembly protein PilP